MCCHEWQADHHRSDVAGRLYRACQGLCIPAVGQQRNRFRYKDGAIPEHGTGCSVGCPGLTSNRWAIALRGLLCAILYCSVFIPFGACHY